MILNDKELRTSQERRLVLDLLVHGTERVLPENTIRHALSYDDGVVSIQDDEYTPERIFIAGGGKPADSMTAEAVRIIGEDNIEAGVINCKRSGSIGPVQ